MSDSQQYLLILIHQIMKIYTPVFLSTVVQAIVSIL